MNIAVRARRRGLKPNGPWRQGKPSCAWMSGLGFIVTIAIVAWKNAAS
jgi:hypothetical protein